MCFVNRLSLGELVGPLTAMSVVKDRTLIPKRKLSVDSHDCKDAKREKKVNWWSGAIMYHLYVRSYCDSTGDGIGDLRGVKSKLPYLAELGIGIVWLSPVFKSPMADFGYDISDFTDIDPIFGNMADFDEVVKEAHSLGLKVVMDLVPNHSSDEHDWFLKSVQRIEPYTDYYIWADSVGKNASGSPLPPNNWLSVFGGSAWEWSEERQQFYFHQFLYQQPDLNYRNSAVRQEMNDIIKFWMDKGVDGMRLDAIKHLFEVEDISQDEALSGNPLVSDPNEYEYLNHNLTTDLEETFDVLREWRELLDSYSDPKLMMAEVYYDSMDAVMRYYGTEEDPLADFPFNFNFINDFKNRSDLTGFTLKESIDDWIDNVPEDKWPNWVIGNHDNPRVSARLGTDLIDAFNMVNLLLPGTAITYYGEEIGMEDTFISYNDTVDPAGCNWGTERYMEFSRDPARTPMQWDNTTNAGFSSGSSTWLPVNPNYKELNVEAQKTASQSHYLVYKSLADLRTHDTFRRGEVAHPVVTDTIFSFVRYLGDSVYIIVVNTHTETVTVDLHTSANFQLPEEAEVVLRSSTDERSSTEPGKEIDLSSVTIFGGEGMVLKKIEESEGH